MTQLIREEAFTALEKVGFPTGLFRTAHTGEVPFLTVMVAVGGAESDLTVDAEGPPNSNGTVDRGWLQINSVHGYDNERLLTDPAYTAQAAFNIFCAQGSRAWAAYSSGAYVRRLPPVYGGTVLGKTTMRSQPYELVKTVQARLNALKASAVPLVVDGAFGAKTEAALIAWKKTTKLEPHGLVDGPTWTALGVR